MKLALVIVSTLLSFNAFASAPVVSQIDPANYASQTYQGWAKQGDKEVVVAWYNNSEDSVAACEVYYKTSLDGEYFLQGWAINSAPQLCITIADNIAANLRNGFAGSTYTDASTVIDEGAIDWTGGEFQNQISIP